MSIISTIQNLDDKEIELIFKNEDAQKPISVCQYQQYRWLRIYDDTIQSVVDTEKPGEVIVPACQAMLLSLCFVERAQNALILGSGGGALERFFCQYLPAVKLVPIEKSRQIINIARDYFFYPPDIAVGNGRADHFLADFPNKFDLIYCDIFEGNKHANCVSTALFHQDMQKRLSKNGVAAINLLTKNQAELAEAIRCIREAFLWTALYLVPDYHNAVVFAGNRSLDKNTAFYKKLLQAVFKETNIAACMRRIEVLSDRY